MKKAIFIIIGILLILVVLYLLIMTGRNAPTNVDIDAISKIVEDAGGFELIGLRLKPKRFWKTSPEWEAYKLLKGNYQGFPTQIKEKLEIIFDWTATEIIRAERENMILKKEMRFSKKRFFVKIIQNLRRRKKDAQ